MDAEGMRPIRFIGEAVQVEFDGAHGLDKNPTCPQRFVWRDETHVVSEILSEWRDYGRRGRMTSNMRPEHAATAARRGSWGVGRLFFRIRTESDQVFDLYYDRAPQNARDRKGGWHLFRELRAGTGREER